MGERTPEQEYERLADILLEQWATENLEGSDDPGDVLRRNGILNRRRIHHVHQIEVSINRLERFQDTNDAP